MEELLQILRKVKPGVDFEGKTDLFESGVLDSMTIVMLAAEINDEFDIDIQVTDIVPGEFQLCREHPGDDPPPPGRRRLKRWHEKRSVVP